MKVKLPPRWDGWYADFILRSFNIGGNHLNPDEETCRGFFIVENSRRKLCKGEMSIERKPTANHLAP
jgi:hypothetical protein